MAVASCMDRSLQDVFWPAEHAAKPRNGVMVVLLNELQELKLLGSRGSHELRPTAFVVGCRTPMSWDCDLGLRSAVGDYDSWVLVES